MTLGSCARLFAGAGDEIGGGKRSDAELLHLMVNVGVVARLRVDDLRLSALCDELWVRQCCSGEAHRLCQSPSDYVLPNPSSLSNEIGDIIECTGVPNTFS